MDFPAAGGKNARRMNAVFPVPVSRGWRRLLLAAAVAGFLLFFLPIPAGMPPLGFGLQLSEMYHALYFSFFLAVFLALAPLCVEPLPILGIL